MGADPWYVTATYACCVSLPVSEICTALLAVELCPIPSESTLRKATPNVGSRGILQGPVASFVESTVKSDDGPNNALDSVSVDGTHRNAQLSRNPKDGAFIS